MGKKITQLATITEVADDDLIVGVDVSDTSGSDNGTNKKFTKATLLDGLAPLNPQLTGWNPDAETWVYHNVDDPTGYFKIEGKDVSANYSVGWRIMFTNGGNVIKGIITAITYSDPDTIITFLHEIDPTDSQALHLLTNSAITENYYSPHKAPLGFPLSPLKWSVEVTDTANRQINPATAGTWYNAGSLSISVPIGSWSLSYEGIILAYATATIQVSVSVTLSTANNSQSDAALTGFLGFNHSTSGTLWNGGYVRREKNLDVTSKTAYYLNIRYTATESATVRVVELRGDFGATIIRATCAYL